MHKDLILVTIILMLIYAFVLMSIGSSTGDNILGFCIIAVLYAGFYQLHYRCLDASVYNFIGHQDATLIAANAATAAAVKK